MSNLQSTLNKQFTNIYMISDASGETVASIGKAMIAQFEEDLEITEYLWPLVRSKEKIDQIFKEIKINHAQGVLLYTVLDSELRNYLHVKAAECSVLAISVLEEVVNEIAEFMGIVVKEGGMPGKYKKLDANYYKKIDILNFTMQHDDGSDSKNYNDADILILGISRTSKSPTSLYLAQRGYKVANLPIINQIPVDISYVHNPLIVGLTISADLLMQIRSNRLSSYNHNIAFTANNDQYTEFDSIREEVQYALQIFRRHQIPIIDVSRKAIEEVAAEVMNLYCAKKGEFKIIL